MNPISVIIVNFNGGPLLSDCVESVLSSSIPVEVIVSDNFSTDSSIAELRRRVPSDERLKLIENQDNLGFAKANNIALAEAHGDFVLFLNPDCIIKPNTLQEMLTVMDSDPMIGMAGCLIRNPDGSEQAGCRRNIPTPWSTFIRITRLHKFGKHHPAFQSYVQTGLPMPEEPSDVEAISGAFMLVRKTAIENVGVMDEGYFMHCEDLDWCMRFHQAGWKIIFVPDVQITHVGGVCSASRPVSVEYYKHIGMVRFYLKFFRDKYSFVLMWMVMVAIGARFAVRAVSNLYRPLFPKYDRRALGDFEGAGAETNVNVNSMAPQDRAAGQSVIVTGATSLIGDYLLPALLKAGYRVHALSRNPPPERTANILTWHKVDISSESLPDFLDCDILIHLAPLATLPPLLNSFRGNNMKRIIAFGSTSLFTKYESSYERERLMARGLGESEDHLREFCTARGIQWTVFRPTLVYHLGRDKNITTIAHFIRRFRIFPIVGHGDGLRQPVHAEDLAEACLLALNNPRTFNQAYNLSGGEILTYLDMVKRLSASIGRKCRIINIPLPAFRIFLRAMSRIPGYSHLTPEMANRINRDMCFSHQIASDDFEFNPRPFVSQRR